MNVATNQDGFQGPDNGSATLQFLDTERQNFAEGLSDEQKEDAAKATGMGVTFGTLGMMNEEAPENRGAGLARKARKMDLPEASIPLIREFGTKGAVRRFAQPFAAAGLASYFGGRATDNLLSEKEIYEREGDPRAEIRGQVEGMPPVGDEDPMSKVSSKTSWLDDFTSWAGDTLGMGAKSTKNTGDDIEMPDAEDAIEEFGRRQETGDIPPTETLTPKQTTDKIEDLRRELQLEEAGKKVRNDTQFQAKRTFEDFKNEAGKYTPDLNMRGALETFGGAGVLGGAGYFGSLGYKGTQPDNQLSRTERRRQRMARTGMHPAGPFRHATPQAEKQASTEKIAEGEEELMGGAAAAGAGAAALNPRSRLYHGTDAESVKSIMEEGFDPEENMLNTIDDKNRTFFARQYTKTLGDLSKDTPTRPQRIGGAPPNSGSSFLDSIRPSSVWDLTSNYGRETVEARLPLHQFDYEGGTNLTREVPDVITENDALPNPTVGVEGKISPEYIKGSGKYSGPGASEVLDYIKKTPTGKAGAGLLAAGTGAMGIGASEMMGEEESEEMEKESASTRLKDLERRGDKVKYRGKWYTPDQPVESWRSGKKRAVLATKEEDGEKVVKLVHYGSSDHDHNYSEKAKENYLARSRGITDGGGNPTKDDPHSANHWSIKDLWPEDNEPDGSALMDLGEVTETPPEKSASIGNRLEGAIKTAAGEGILGSGITAEQADGPAAAVGASSFAGPALYGAIDEARGVGGLRKKLIRGTAGAIEGLGAPGRGVQSMLGAKNPAPTGDLPTRLPGSVETLAESYGLGKPDRYYRNLAQRARDDRPNMEAIKETFGDDAELTGSGATGLNVPGGDSDVDVVIRTDSKAETDRRFNELMNNLSGAREHSKSKGRDSESFGMLYMDEFGDKVDFKVSHSDKVRRRGNQMRDVAQNMDDARKGRMIEQKRNMQEYANQDGLIAGEMGKGDYAGFKRSLDEQLGIEIT